MSEPSQIVLLDAEIERVLQSAQGRAASVLLDRYRCAGPQKDAFVAALIGRVCVAHQRSGDTVTLRPAGKGV